MTIPFLRARALRARNRYFLLADVVALPLAAALAFVIRFEGAAWPDGIERVLLGFVALVLPVKLGLHWLCGLYRRLWQYASIADLERILAAAIASSAAALVLGVLVLPAIGAIPQRVPLSVVFIDAFLATAFVSLPRLLVRITARWRHGRALADGRRVLVAGAGAAGGLIMKELLANPQLGMCPVGFVDDDVAKHHHKIHNLPVLGPLAELERIVERYEVGEVIIAMPRAPGRTVRDVVRATYAAGATARTVPGVFEIISGRKSVSALRQVEIQDLLRREPVRTDLEQVRALATGRTVLVTGAGGSIGSELCRQLAGLAPARIIAVGRGENSIFELLQELGSTFPDLPVVPVIADVRDHTAIRAVFRQHRPFSVFHAAAHKHVPLMEQNIGEAVLNNVLGTENVVRVAAEYDTQHFVLISTDKAVRPTSIMGATKRIAEAVVHDVARHNGLPYVSVRFGNVLGSRGSVVPTFLRQIEAGGPVTVTHPEMRRYFMTIPEAVQLVLQAGALGRGSETFVLDMGEPVRIADLAADLIRLSGLEVGTDVEIQYTGVRPGEKLYEELFFSAECATPTVHPKVLRAKSVESDPSIMHAIHDLIAKATQNAAPAELRRLLKAIVPDYQPAVGMGDVIEGSSAAVRPNERDTRSLARIEIVR